MADLRPVRLRADGWQVTQDLPHNHLIHEGDDGPDGILAWSAGDALDGWHAPLGTVKAEGLFAASDEAERNLWCYLSGLALVDSIELSGPVDEPVTWLLADPRALRTTEIADHLWLKLLDVPAALAARRYAVPGEFVLEVVDDSPVSVAGRYRLRVEGGHVAAAPTHDSPALTLAQTVLAATYLGGASLRGQLIARTVSEHTAGALQLADAMFATPLAPYNATGF